MVPIDMAFIINLINYVAPLFLVTSPITSYADQIYSIHRTRNSAGFSLDIPLIMLVASILKVYYWIGARFATSLLLQSLLMIVVQTLLLHVALTHRPNPAIQAPFSGNSNTKSRPFDFWQWRPHRPYWSFLTYFTITLLALQIVFGSFPAYTTLQGYIALAIEATLPLPQILANHRRKCCAGFRVSVLANWLLGDALKMCFFFAAGDGEGGVPWAFKACGIFQASCDAYLGIQYWMYGADEQALGVGMAENGFAGKLRQEKDHMSPAPTSIPVELWEKKRASFM